MQAYDFTVNYVRGDDNIADFLSRQRIKSTLNTLNENERTNQYVNFIIKHSTPSSLSIKEIRDESLKDEVLKSIMAAIQTGNWSNPILKEYECMKLQFCESNGVVLREHRIMLPYALQEKAISIVHHGHLGMEKSKQLLRSSACTGCREEAQPYPLACVPSVSLLLHRCSSVEETSWWHRAGWRVAMGLPSMLRNHST